MKKKNIRIVDCIKAEHVDGSENVRFVCSIIIIGACIVGIHHIVGVLFN